MLDNDISQQILANIDLERIEAFIFDCDGTLVDSMPMHNEMWQRVLEKHGLPQAFHRTLELTGTPDKQIVETLNREYDTNLNPQQLSTEKLALALQHVEKIKPIQAIVNIAKQYYQKLPLAVVSGGERVIVEKSLQSNQLSELFSTTICADVPVASKPAPDIFLYAAQQLGVAPEKCHVFEDGDGGITGALAAGMSVTDVRLYL